MDDWREEYGPPSLELTTEQKTAIARAREETMERRAVDEGFAARCDKLRAYRDTWETDPARNFPGPRICFGCGHRSDNGYGFSFTSGQPCSTTCAACSFLKGAGFSVLVEQKERIEA